MSINRRGFILGLSALAAPAIIKTPGLLMPVRQIITIDQPKINKAKAYYINPETGSDLNTGLSWDSAFKTLKPAYNLLTPGFCLFVANGQYNSQKHTKLKYLRKDKISI